MPAFRRRRLKVPQGIRLALKPRVTRPGDWRDVMPRASDRIEVIPESEVMDRIKEQQKHKQTPKALLWYQFNQDGHGSCAAEMGHGLIQDLMAIENQPRVLTNPWPTYRHCTDRDDGASLDRVLRHLCEKGALPDEVWPRYDARGKIIHGWKEWPPDELFREHGIRLRIHEFADVDAKGNKAKWEQARTLALMGTSVGIGHNIYGGGHAEGICELIDRDTFWLHNSWGASRRLHKAHWKEINWMYGAFAPLSLVAQGA